MVYLVLLLLAVAVVSATATASSQQYVTTTAKANKLTSLVETKSVENGVSDAALSKKVSDLNSELTALKQNMERAKVTRRAARAAAAATAAADEERKKQEAVARSKAAAQLKAAAAAAAAAAATSQKQKDAPLLSLPAWARAALAAVASTQVWPAVCALDAHVRMHIFPILPDGSRSYTALGCAALAIAAVYGAYASVALAAARRRLRAQAKELALLWPQEAGLEIARLQAQVKQPAQ